MVTGGAGYVGSHTTLVLLQAGYQVVVVDNCINAKPPRPPSNLPPSLERVRKLVATSTPPSLHFYHLSLQDRQELRAVFEKHCVEVVIHFAGLKAVGESVKRPLDYYANNLTSTITLLQVMSEVGCRVLVFSSSSTVYGPATYFPTDEDHPTGPAITNPYGRTKYFCEQVMRDVAAQDKRWSVVVLRYFNPVGAHSSGLLGDDPVTGRPVNLLPSLAHVAAGRKKVFQIFGEDWDTPDGTCIRDFMHVMDLAEGHVAALEHALTHTGASVFNLGRGEGVSVKQMIQAFESQPASVPLKVLRVQYLTADSLYNSMFTARESSPLPFSLPSSPSPPSSPIPVQSLPPPLSTFLSFPSPHHTHASTSSPSPFLSILPNPSPSPSPIRLPSPPSHPPPQSAPTLPLSLPSPSPILPPSSPSSLLPSPSTILPPSLSPSHLTSPPSSLLPSPSLNPSHLTSRPSSPSLAI
ncbi:hypothetical protein Pcinc_031268 [Petrolisthes cinctipes]|uniref:UDP-N-acetylglucosamine 4-epimerase n=1 Tax=Petrolisthes cinctipes TaxID=88211 RepID=A0AAE1EWZ4_PETCI|nr:hypothetical protein Pcinc_031268 [Petrolisthes cinctipes]